MTVNEMTDRFARLESDIASRKGDFVLFALFMREDAPDRWDLIASAPWFDRNQQTAVDYLIGEIRSALGPQDLTNLSRIVVADPEDLAVQNLNRMFPVEHGGLEVRDSSFFGLPVKHAFIITSKRPATAVTKQARVSNSL